MSRDVFMKTVKLRHMDNYPIGAAHDPDAPYNKGMDEYVDVEVREVLVKQSQVMVGPTWNESDLKEYYSDQDDSVMETLKDCKKIIEGLIAEGSRFYCNIHLPFLLSNIESWEQESFEVTDCACQHISNHIDSGKDAAIEQALSEQPPLLDFH